MLLKAMIAYVHVLSMIGGFTAMIVTESIIWRRFKKFNAEDFDNIRFLSNIVAIALGLLWLTGVALIVVGYLDDPNYITNQKIWAKVAIVSVMTLNGIYISRRIMPRIEGLQSCSTLVSSQFESAMFRFSFAISLSGWMLAAFFGVARFMDHSYPMFTILNLYIMVVGFIFMASYIFGSAEFLRPENRGAANN